MKKDTVIVVLVALNLVLLAGIIFSVSTPSAAYAQAVGSSGNYIMVSGQVERGNDAMYLFDLQNRVLHVFRSSRARPVTIAHVDTRDLTRDFRPR